MESPKFPEWPIQSFVERLAEANPLPGGGCAVALAGALAAALGSLATQLSLKNPRHHGDDQRDGEFLDKIKEHQSAFLNFLDADALAYQAVVQAQRLPGHTAEQSLSRRQALDAAFLKACEPPLGMAHRGLELLQGAALLAEQGYPVTLADVGVMAFLAEAVVQGALINIFSNLSIIRDSTLTRTVREQAWRIKEQLQGLVTLLRSLLDAQIGKRP
ncbi:MAG: cyclodeaminase/cyclohydrolase family protein [Deltaproteobacteria bacterium]|nr:cyclodeaminase/cyclohydrolase family protein [Deltaproteobacteria bacterium]MBW1951555.1 cyclodeaminase/cyclohydrolase family protein [Deltaproteobacteria bacterium]MBW1986802.1 cyclodeaminase/cyclohydrolase family protein [Deltaproteobacteria bacterium]MBW2135222.1 cyclodeaminase/cyclohydrolase family protein [Deltaproteobacteria bacterium]